MKPRKCKMSRKETFQKNKKQNRTRPRKVKKPRKTAAQKNQTQISISIDQTSSVEIQQSQVFAENWISKPEVVIGFNKLWDLNLKTLRFGVFDFTKIDLTDNSDLKKIEFDAPSFSEEKEMRGHLFQII